MNHMEVLKFELYEDFRNFRSLRLYHYDSNDLPVTYSPLQLVALNCYKPQSFGHLKVSL